MADDIFNEPEVDIDKLIEDIDLEKLLKEFINHRNHKKIKKFKQRVFVSFIFDHRLCQGALNSTELAIRILRIYVSLGIVIKKEVKSIYPIATYEYKINLPN